MKIKFGIMGAMLVGSAAFAADGIKLGGFVNATYDWMKVPGGRDVNTFSIPDGAVYLGKTLGMGEVMLDLPLASLVTPNTRAGVGVLPAAANATSDNAILAGFGKAQAYVQWKFENGFNWKLGQFDGIYGAESNDAADRFFSKTGVLYSHVPVTHTGLLLGYDFSDALGLNLLLANPADQGRMVAGNPDFGVKLSTKMDGLKASLGFLMQNDPGKGQGGSGQNGWLIDVTAGTNMDQLSADLEAQIAKGKTTSVGSYVTTGDETAFGIALHLGYGLTEEVKAGLRGEYYKVGDHKTFTVSLGPKFTLSKDLDVGVEYYLVNDDKGTVGSKSVTNHAIALSAINRF